MQTAPPPPLRLCNGVHKSSVSRLLMLQHLHLVLEQLYQVQVRVGDLFVVLLYVREGLLVRWSRAGLTSSAILVLGN